MKLPFLILAISALALAGPTTGPGAAEEMSTPIKSLTYIDRVIQHQGFDAILSTYHCTNDKEAGVARALATADVAETRLEAAVTTRFGKAAFNNVLHALDGWSGDDLKDAVEKIEGNKATVVFSGRPDDTMQMIRIDGVWKISVAAAIDNNDDPAALHELRRSFYQLADDVDKLARQVEQNQFKTSQEIVDAGKQITAEVFPQDPGNPSNSQPATVP